MKETKMQQTYKNIEAGEAAVQRNYKDTIFRMLFKDKANMLSLYNALNDTAYTNEDELEITTLENAVYMNYKNDISFVFDFELMLYEHQSTINPNMPLRDLFYVARVLQNRSREDNLYTAKLIKIPAPRFVREGTLAEAVEMAVDYCIENGILSDFLSKNRAEAIAMCIYEYDEEKHIKCEREWAYERGFAENLIKSVESVMKNLNLNLQEACEGVGTTVEEYQKAKERMK